MYEEAQKIFDYLPIRASQNEIEYIDHLWSSTIKLYLDNKDIKTPTKSFSIMPFHILFILTLQYKILRIKKQRSLQYNERIKKYYGGEKQYQLLEASSVYEFGLIAETSLPGILNIIGLPDEIVGRIKNLVLHRNNNVAHAKGGFIFEVEEKIDEYIECLAEVQKCMEGMNNEISEKWLREIGSDGPSPKICTPSLYNY